MRALAILLVASHMGLVESACGAIPADFRVEAIFGAGGGSAPAGDGTSAITVIIMADGRASLKSAGYYTHDLRVSTRIETSRLSPARVEEIVAAMQRTKFLSLPPDMDGADDSLHYVLIVTAHGRKHRVDVTPPFDKLPELRRFRTVWTSVMQAMPSPLGRVATKHLQKYI